MKYFYILLIVLSATSFARAAYLDIHLLSKHTRDSIFHDNERTELNERNLGIGLSLPTKNSDYVDTRIGFFNNSFNDTSYYVGLDFHTPHIKTLSYGISVGVVNGYDAVPNGEYDTLPFILPHINYNTKQWRMQLGYLPSIGISALTLSIGYNF